MKTGLFSILTIFFFQSCAFFQNKPKLDVTPYITGENLEETTSGEIRAALTKIGYMAGGQYEVEVVPITSPLIEKQVEEQARLRGWGDYEKKIILDKRKKDYLSLNSCFEVKFSIVKFKEVSTLDKWKAKIITLKGSQFNLKWRQEDINNRPVQSYFNGLYGKEEKWFNSGIACAQVDLRLEEGFHVEVEPSFVQWPFPNSTTLTWGLLDSSFQSYRGW